MRFRNFRVHTLLVYANRQADRLAGCVVATVGLRETLLHLPNMHSVASNLSLARAKPGPRNFAVTR
jgi:hypothetical protein